MLSRVTCARRQMYNRMVEAAVATYGSLDIWVNDAGIFYPVSPVLQMSEELWDRVLRVNLKGTFMCSQAAARQMVSQGHGGVILNIVSIDAVHPGFVGPGAYDASKGGMVMLTKSLALEVGPRGHSGDGHRCRWHQHRGRPRWLHAQQRFQRCFCCDS
jgi:NAD(P)-dependent dehydrogenase (short-subunit alcohol dehydrogenase family)